MTPARPETSLPGTGSTLRFRLLGSVEVIWDGAQVPIRAAKHRIVLATLLLGAGRTVTAQELINNLWDADPPDGARTTLRAYVMRLRQAIGIPDLITTVTDGYRIDVPPDTIDVARFQRLLATARTEQPATAFDLLTEALALWRGSALADVPSANLREHEVASLDEQRLQAAALRVDVAMELGRHHELITELRALTTGNPLRERFWAQLMLALYRSDRQAEALTIFHHVRSLLAAELRVEPSRELRDLHQAILTSDPKLAPPAPSLSVQAPVFQVPTDGRIFVGRAGELARVSDLLAPAELDLAVPVVTVSGPAGVGKTALAVQVARTLRPRFPDGQLFVHLRGQSSGQPLAPADVLPRLLRALGVPAKQIPVDEDEQISLYRSQLASKRVLIVLDNATTPDQVRPLLPGEPGCAVLITSRNALRGLIVLQGASPVSLDVLPANESRALLTDMLGENAVRAEPDAVAELATLCAHLPLALRIAAGTLARQHSGIAAHVNRLRESGLLNALAVEGDEQAAVHAAFDLAYEALPDHGRRMLRLLALTPSVEFGPLAAAALSGTTPEEVAGELADLDDANLIRQHASGRFHLHDLVRGHARGRAEREDSEQDRAAALDRLRDSYLHSVVAATTLLSLTLPFDVKLPPAAGDTSSVRFTDRHAALAWLEEERATMVAVVRDAANHTLPSAWYLAVVLSGFLVAYRHSADAVGIAQTAWQVAGRLGDGFAQGATSYCLATAHADLGQLRQALDHFEQAVTLFRTADATAGEAAALSGLAAARALLGGTGQAAPSATDALSLARAAGAVGTEATTLSRLGYIYHDLGRFEEAVSFLNQALTCFQNIASVTGEAMVRNNLANTYRELGRFDDAIVQMTASLRLRKELASGDAEFDVLDTCAAVHVDLGQYELARREAEESHVLAVRSGARSATVNALNTIATLDRVQNVPDRALARHSEALRISRAAGFRFGELHSQLGLARTRLVLADPLAAIEHARQALAIGAEATMRCAEAATLRTAAEIHLALGELGPALDRAETAAGLAARTGQRLVQGRALLTAGRVHAAGGATDAARANWRRAADVLEDLVVPETATAAALLDGHGR